MLWGLVLVFQFWPSVVSAQTLDSERPVIAVMAPLSGELAGVGEQLVEAAQLAAEGTGVTIEGIDEGDSPERTRQAFREMEQRTDVVAVIGPMQRRHGPAAAQMAQQLGLPLMLYSTMSGLERRGDWVFRSRPGIDEQAQRLAEYIREKADAQQVAVMAPRTGHGDEVVPQLVEAIGQTGATVRSLIRYEDDTSDFGPFLQVLSGERAFVGPRRTIGDRRSGADGTLVVRSDGEIDVDTVVVVDYHDRVARLLPFLPRAGIRTGASSDGVGIQLVGLSGWRGDGLALAGDHGAGAIFFDTFGAEADGLTARDFVIRFRDATDREPTTPEAEVYDLVRLLSDLIEMVPQTRARQVIRDRLMAGRSFEGISGEWRFTAGGTPIRTLRPYRVIDGGNWVRADGELR